MNPIPDLPPGSSTTPEWRRKQVPGLLAGLVALATAWFALPVIATIPFAGLAVNLALAWGTYTVIGIGIQIRPTGHGVWVPTLAPWLAVPMLLRMHVSSTSAAMPDWVAATWTLEALALVAGVATTLAYTHLLGESSPNRAAFWTSGILGASLATLLVLMHITTPHSIQAGARAVFGIALVCVVVALVMQFQIARRSTGPRIRLLAGGAALAATASQLLDGFVTYFAVVDPFNLLAAEMHEQVAVSAWLLEHTGFGYPVVKWALAITIAILLERGWKQNQTTKQRAGVYLVLILVGLGPALFSTASLLNS